MRPFRILIVTPARPGFPSGNRVTSSRWAELLRTLGGHVRVEAVYRGGDADLLIALHAHRSHASVARFRREHPRAPIVLGLSGTDIYAARGLSPAARRSIALADRLVVLQPEAVRALPRGYRAKTRVIPQSATALRAAGAPSTAAPRAAGAPRAVAPRGAVPRTAAAPRAAALTAGSPSTARRAAALAAPAGAFDVCVIGHLRRVKDPFRAAMASRLLPQESRMAITHVGSGFTEAMRRRAKAEQRRNRRYRWLGGRPREETLRLLARCRALVLSSWSEGGANVVSEAIAASVPVLASRVPGSVGLLGRDYPGYFPAGDTRALAKLLWRFENDGAFRARLARRIKRLRPLVLPDRERRAWRDLIEEFVEAMGTGGPWTGARGKRSGRTRALLTTA